MLSIYQFCLSDWDGANGYKIFTTRIFTTCRASSHLILITNNWGAGGKVWLAPFPDATVKAQGGDVSYLKSHNLKAGEQDVSPVWPTSVAGCSPYR